MSETLDQLAGMNGTMDGQGPAPQEELPQGEANQQIQETATLQEQETTPAPAQEEFFEVDGQKFADEKAAFDYLKKRNTELEAERMVEAARIETMQEMMRQNQGQVSPEVAKQVEADPAMDMDAFYADPVGYLQKQRQEIKKEVLNEVTSQQTAAQRQQQVWNDFTRRHPDLADMQDIVELVANQNGEVVQAMAARNPEKAYDFIATKVRERFQSFIESQKPTRELPQTKGGPSPGSNQQVTPQQSQQKNDKPIAFIDQVRQHRNRT